MKLNTQMGLGHDHFDPALGAWVSDYRFSESNHRQFYRKWSEMMDGDRRSEPETIARRVRYA
jgi:hypothetical protein